MIDKVTVTQRRYDELSKTARKRVHGSLGAEARETGAVAAIDVCPQDSRQRPVRPLLHVGDWMDDGQGTMWTVLTVILHEDDDNFGNAYLWHEYEVASGMHLV